MMDSTYEDGRKDRSRTLELTEVITTCQHFCGEFFVICEFSRFFVYFKQVSSPLLFSFSSFSANSIHCACTVRT